LKFILFNIVEAVKRLLAQLPISAQSYSSSPYLDLALFSYDDKWVSVMERPKPCGDHPIRYDRKIFKYFLLKPGVSFLKGICPDMKSNVKEFYEQISEIEPKNSIKPGQTAQMCRLAWLYIGGKGLKLLVPAG
jgi:hypothetical protein